MSNEIVLTEEQKAIAKEYKDRYFKIALNTDPCDRDKGTKAIIASYQNLIKKKQAGEINLNTELSPNPNVFWFDSPTAAVTAIVQKLHPNLDKNSPDFQSHVKDFNYKASFGSFESYWISFYDFIHTEIKKENADVVQIARDLATDVGVFWTFNENVFVSDKPCAIHLKDNRLHSVDGFALEYRDGTGVCAINGTKVDSHLDLTLSEIFDKASTGFMGLVNE